MQDRDVRRWLLADEEGACCLLHRDAFKQLIVRASTCQRLTLFVFCSSLQAAPFIRCMGTGITLHTNRASSLPGPNCGSHGCLH